MANGKSSFKNAAAAIYCVCVTKKYPTLPSHYSVDAHRFIDRCLVENPKQRANSTELRTHPFLTQIQSLDAIRAQTAAVSGMNNKTSTVKLDLPHDASFFNSQQFHTCSDGLLAGSGPQEERLRLATSTGYDGDYKGGSSAVDGEEDILRKTKVSSSARLSLTADSKANTMDREIRTRSGSRGGRLSAVTPATTSGKARANSRFDDSDDDGEGGGGNGQPSPHYSTASDDSLFSTTVGHTALHGAPSLMNSSNFHTVYARQLTISSPGKQQQQAVSRTASVSEKTNTNPASELNATFGAAITPARNNLGTFPLTSTDVSGDAASSGNSGDRWSRWNNQRVEEEDETVDSTVSHLFQR